MPVDRKDILEVLSQIALPDGTTLVSRDMIRALTISPEGQVQFVIEAPSPEIAQRIPAVREAAERLVAGLDGVSDVRVILTAHAAPPAAPSLKVGRHPAPTSGGPARLPGVARIVAIGSGKGGVGKSTVSSNLAVALARQGWRVGLLDGDIHGPSQPRMMGVSARPDSPDGKTIVPMTAHGVTMMSIGLMLDPDKAVVWRGPMLMGALQQMMGQVAWGDLDILLIDLPPGTGDVQLTLCQRYVVEGAIVVSTPQDVALLDARKALDMFRTLKTPVLGLIENMSVFLCPHCGGASHIFGTGGVAAEAERLGLPLLGALPLTLEARVAGDAGTPVALSEDPETGAYAGLARDLMGRLVR